MIGLLGFFLPLLVYLFAGDRPTDGLCRWTLLESVSSYYYTGADGVFVGVIFALALFLFTYRGYKEVRADRIVGGLGGSAALVVALFPTGAPEGLCAPSWWHKSTGIAHYVAATTLFISFILFSLWLFRKSDIEIPGDRPSDKRARNGVFLVCGLIMIACVLWAGGASLAHRAIFWPETIAIEAFAVSWLVKGEMHTAAANLARRIVRASD